MSPTRDLRFDHRMLKYVRHVDECPFDKSETSEVPSGSVIKFCIFSPSLLHTERVDQLIHTVNQQ